MKTVVLPKYEEIIQNKVLDNFKKVDEAITYKRTYFDTLTFLKNSQELSQVELRKCIEIGDAANTLLRRLMIERYDKYLTDFEAWTYRKNEVERSKEPRIPLPEGFSQIELDQSKEAITNFFMILTKAPNPINGLPFMPVFEVDRLVGKNFSIYGQVPTGGYSTLNLGPGQKIIIRQFIFEFYEIYDSLIKGGKIKYAKLMIHNFEPFKNEKPEILVSNMSWTKCPKKDRIDIKKYLGL